MEQYLTEKQNGYYFTKWSLMGGGRYERVDCCTLKTPTG